MKTIQQLFEDAGYECRSYSGRGMYDKTCLGVEIDRHKDVLEVVADVLDSLYENEPVATLDMLSQALRDSRQDSMGLGTILYFPHERYERPEPTIDACAECGATDSRSDEDYMICAQCGCTYDE